METGGIFLVVLFAALIIAGVISGRKNKKQQDRERGSLTSSRFSALFSLVKKAHRELHGALFLS